MAESGNRRQLVTHAHILLTGFAVSLFYAIIHKLWLPQPNKAVARAQFVLRQLAAVGLLLGLLLMFGGVGRTGKGGRGRRQNPSRGLIAASDEAFAGSLPKRYDTLRVTRGPAGHSPSQSRIRS